LKQPVTISLHKAEPDKDWVQTAAIVYIHFFHNKITNDYIATKLIIMPAITESSEGGLYAHKIEPNEAYLTL